MRKSRKTPYQQGKFNPSNPDKYIGSLPIFARSSWEIAVMRYLDRTTACISWKSESNVTRYISPIDGKVHRYFIDFEATFKDKDGNIQIYLIEVKPKGQVSPPKNKTKSYENRMKTYLINQAKWKSAKKYAESRGKKFIILTENEIFKSKI